MNNLTLRNNQIVDDLNLKLRVLLGCLLLLAGDYQIPQSLGLRDDFVLEILQEVRRPLGDTEKRVEL